jgi:hypothetical protein
MSKAPSKRSICKSMESDEGEIYCTYLDNLINYYQYKFMNLYQEYRTNSRKLEKEENVSFILQNALTNDNTFLRRNPKYAYITKRMNALIDGFDILYISIDTTVYDDLPPDNLQKLQDAYMNYIQSC